MRRTMPTLATAAAAGVALLLPVASPLAAAPTEGATAATDGAEQSPYYGYLFSYFTGEGAADGEQVYFGLSRGDDPLDYRTLNDGDPVLTSEIGDEGVRDPFIIRSPDGETFYQIATDLKVHGDGDWDAIQRHGSRSIVVWESDDLVTWSEPRLVEVAPENAGNAWAPEAYYDEELGEYVVFWASKLYAEDDPEHAGTQHNRMMYATTEDFVEFSEPQVWIDPGYSVIDSTVIREDDQYYRFTKDERSTTGDSPCGKFITAEKSPDLRSTDYEFIADCLGKDPVGGSGISQGEGPLVFQDNDAERWYMFIDEFGGRGYVPFVTDDLDSGEWRVAEGASMPERPRHGTVLPVTREEYERLLAAYQPDALISEVEPVEVIVRKQQVPRLPEEVAVTFADGETGTAPVDWEELDAEDFRKKGTVEVTGSVVDAAEPAVVEVTVQPQPVRAEGLEITGADLDDGAMEIWQGTSSELSADATPANATKEPVWTTSDPDVVAVEDGTLTAVAPGTARVSAHVGRHRQTVEVTVTEEPPGLVGHWPLRESADSAIDGVGDAELVGGASADGRAVQLDGVDDHVALPDDLLAGLEDVTVSIDVRISEEQQSPYFIYGLGNSAGGAGDGYLFSTGDPYRTSISDGNWAGEQTVSAGEDLERGTWTTLTWTLNGETAALHRDGVEVARSEDVDLEPGDIGGGTTTENAIGRSLYETDHRLSGAVRDFRLYDRALSAEEVAEVAE